ncbi:nucleotide-binding domain-containing protein [Penicillium nucicola]|uniref:nucleotide-binding domain-containing protein n=1 Tax=Penicillium nucicola TaxID=1850975 RepID=UPI002545537D|nr:nucleotide-binding domain-containing protein [Penicillium nucicola]KAJ5742570.1 nucleotide-binding domain-containing protein [Penicillium nucicola]
MTTDGKTITITHSATIETETKSESTTTTEPTSTITVGLVVGTYTAFAEPTSSLGTSTVDITSLMSIATLQSKLFSSLYSGEQYSLTASLYTTTTSTSTTSTSTTSKSTSATTSASATPSERFIITLTEDDNELGNPYTWEYFDPTYSESYSFCEDSLGTLGEGPSDGEGLPNGTFDISVDIHGMSDCVYVGTTDAPGTFTCPGLSSTVDCIKSPQTTGATCYEISAPVEYTPKIQCSW